MRLPDWRCDLCGGDLSLEQKTPGGEIVPRCGVFRSCRRSLGEAVAFGLWILANAVVSQQLASRAIFAQLREDLDRDGGTDFFPIGEIMGTRVELAEGIRVAGKRTLWVRLPGEGFSRSQLRTPSPRATPPGTPPKRRKRR